MNEPIIFLDFDGVLSTEHYATQCQLQGIAYADSYGALFDPQAVRNLGIIVQTAHASIVAITSWRQQGLDYLRRWWHHRHMPGALIDMVPTHVAYTDLALHHLEHLSSSPLLAKGTCIALYLAENYPGQQPPYVILDDQPVVHPHQQSHYVAVCEYSGLTHADALRAIEILSAKP